MKTIFNTLIGAILFTILFNSCGKKNVVPIDPINPIDTVDIVNPIDTNDVDTTSKVVLSIFGDGSNGTIDTTVNFILEGGEADPNVPAHIIQEIYPNLVVDSNVYSNSLRVLSATNTTTQVMKNGVILDNTKQNQLFELRFIGKGSIEYSLKDIDMVTNSKVDIFEYISTMNLYDYYSWNNGFPSYIYNGNTDFNIFELYQNDNYNYKSDDITRSQKLIITYQTANKVYVLSTFSIGTDKYEVRSLMTRTR